MSADESPTGAGSCLSPGAGSHALGGQGALLRTAARLELIVPAVLSLLLAVLLFGQGGQDDSYITFWPARTLAEHGQILNYNGVRLEQSSSLSLVVVLALLYKLLPLSLPTVGYLTSLSAALVTMLLAPRIAGRMGLFARAGIVATIGTVGCFGYWATSGMETPLVTASALWVIDELVRPAGRSVRADRLRLGVASLLFA